MTNRDHAIQRLLHTLRNPEVFYSPENCSGNLWGDHKRDARFHSITVEDLLDAIGDEAHRSSGRDPVFSGSVSWRPSSPGKRCRS